MSACSLGCTRAIPKQQCHVSVGSPTTLPDANSPTYRKAYGQRARQNGSKPASTAVAKGSAEAAEKVTTVSTGREALASYGASTATKRPIIGAQNGYAHGHSISQGI